jgi:hypothetical protein
MLKSYDNIKSDIIQYKDVLVITQQFENLFIVFYYTTTYSIYLPIYLAIYLWLYSPLLDLGRFFSFLINTQSVGPLGRGSARRKAATRTQDNTNTE